MAQFTPDYLQRIAKPLLSQPDLNLAEDFAKLFQHSGDDLDHAIQQFVHKTALGMEQIKSAQDQLACSQALEEFLNKTVEGNSKLNDKLNQIKLLAQDQKFIALIAFLKSIEYRKYLAKILMIAHENRPAVDFIQQIVNQGYKEMNQAIDKSADQLLYRAETRIYCQIMKLLGQMFEIALILAGVRPGPEALVNKPIARDDFRPPMPGPK